MPTGAEEQQTTTSEQRLGEQLVQIGRITREQLTVCLDLQRQRGGPERAPLVGILADLGLSVEEADGTATVRMESARQRHPTWQEGGEPEPGASWGSPARTGHALEHEPATDPADGPPSETNPGRPSSTPRRSGRVAPSAARPADTRPEEVGGESPSWRPEPTERLQREDIPEPTERLLRDPRLSGRNLLAAREAEQASQDPEKRIGRYVVLDQLGRGGMGLVYRGFDMELQRQVAIKMIRDVEGVGERERARFLKEARSNARVRHPNIVAVHEVGEHDGKPYLVMDFIDGETLEDALVRRDRMSPRRIAEIIRDVALALAHAHAHDIIHRDVKPQNILLDVDGKPHLVDFGLARDMTDAAVTHTSHLMGTPYYVSPEQARGDQRAMGPLSDVYGLGGVLYRSLAGRPPFAGKTVVEVMNKVFGEEPVPPRKLRPTIHRDLETIALRCLEKTPARRYAGAEAVAAELRRFLDGESIEARPPGRLELIRRGARRNPLFAAAATALVLTLIGAVGAIALLIGREARAREEAALEGRREVVDSARTDAGRAFAAFADARAKARDATGADGEPGGADRDELLALGLEAMQAGATLVALAPEDTSATADLSEAAFALGEIAMSAELWPVATSAFNQALELGVDEALARAALNRVQVARTRADEEARARVEAVLEEARTGELAKRLGGFDDALFTLVREASPETVRIVAAALDEVSRDIRDVVAQAVRAAEHPTPEEAQRGEGPIDGLAESVARYVAQEPGVRLPPPDLERLRHAARRIEERARRDGARGPRAQAIFAAAQENRVGANRLRLARLCCEALGRMGTRAEAVDALGRYLFAEESPTRAVFPAVALCLLGGPVGIQLVVEATERFGNAETFWLQLAPFIPRVGVELPLEEESAAGYVGRGATRRRLGDVGGAIDDFTAAIDLDARHGPAWRWRGSVHLLIGKHREAIADLTKAIELDPGDAEARTLRGRALTGTDPAAAIADFSRAIAIAPDKGSAWRDRGAAFYRAKDFARAADDLRHASELSPEDPAVWRILGAVELDSGDTVGAIRDFTRAIELEPRSPGNWYNRGEARKQRGELDLALLDFGQVVELDPRNARAWGQRGLVREAIGDLEGAQADLDKAIGLDPRLWGPWAGRGRIRLRRGETRGAIKDLQSAVRLEPRDAPTWTRLGMAHIVAQEWSHAVGALNRAIEIDSADASAFNNRGIARWRLKDLAGALSDFNRSCDLEPTGLTQRMNRAAYLEDRGRVPEAVRDYELVTRIAPRTPEGVEAKRRLARLGQPTPEGGG